MGLTKVCSSHVFLTVVLVVVFLLSDLCQGESIRVSDSDNTQQVGLDMMNFNTTGSNTDNSTQAHDVCNECSSTFFNGNYFIGYLSGFFSCSVLFLFYKKFKACVGSCLRHFAKKSNNKPNNDYIQLSVVSEDTHSK
eukprot:TRINITY_DN4129_c0_g2_i4.p1 TRINITY_DN4129_c0_g2~~TRINITY_DN4129_c0_g2_i4.p1  ORF type:complete len:137 (-),score=16.80 TRINITY_DN4129_c0_g2_i4:263-673(-)